VLAIRCDARCIFSGRTFLPRNNRSRYLVDETHTILGPEANRSMVFVDPAEGKYAGIVYYLEVSATQQIPASCVFAGTSAETGTAFLKINCTGQYVAALHARDVGGADIIVYAGWAFAVTSADTQNSANGPNGEDCNAGFGSTLDRFPAFRVHATMSTAVFGGRLLVGS